MQANECEKRYKTGSPVSLIPKYGDEAGWLQKGLWLV